MYISVYMSNFSSSLIKFCMALWTSKASCLLPITPDMMLSTYQRYLSLWNPLGSGLQSGLFVSIYLQCLRTKLTSSNYGSLYRESNIYEMAEKSQRQQFKRNIRMSAVITFQELLTKCQTITFFITNISDKAPMTTHWLHQLPTIGVDKYTTPIKNHMYRESNYICPSWSGWKIMSKLRYLLNIQNKG